MVGECKNLCSATRIAHASLPDLWKVTSVRTQKTMINCPKSENERELRLHKLFGSGRYHISTHPLRPDPHNNAYVTVRQLKEQKECVDKEMGVNVR